MPSAPTNPPISKVKLRDVFALAVLGLVGLTATLVYLPWQYTSRQNLDLVIEDYNRGLIEGTNQEIDQKFANVAATNRMVERLIQQDILDITDSDQIAEFSINLLRANENYAWVTFGFPNGDVLTVERQTPQSFRVGETVWDDQLGQPPLSAEERRERLVLAAQYGQTDGGWIDGVPGAKRVDRVLRYNTHDDGFVEITREESQNYYFAPIRPWYAAAIRQRGAEAWSAIYAFFSTPDLGIDSSLAMEQDGDTLAVVSISFILAEISAGMRERFADQVQAQRGELLFIATADGQLIASTGTEAMSVNEAGPALLRVNQSTEPAIRIAADAFEANGITYDQISGLTALTYQDPASQDIYHVYAEPCVSETFQPCQDGQWIITTVVPEAIFTEEIDRNRVVLIGVIVTLMLAASGAALVLSRRTLLKPMEAITNAAEVVQQGQYEAVDLSSVVDRQDELGQLATVFQFMADEVAQRERVLKQQVKSLTIQIDQAKRKTEVKEIVETDFFQDLTAKADNIRQTFKQRTDKIDSEPN